MTDNELKEDVKMKLRMYNPYTRKIKQFMLEIESRYERMRKTQWSFIKAPDGTKILDIHKNTSIWDEIYDLEKEIGKFSRTIDQVNNFLKKFDTEQKQIVRLLYMSECKVTQQ